MMLMFTDQNKVAIPMTREQLGDIRTPEGTDSWRPVPHKEVADALIDLARDRGLQVVSERWSVMDGQYYPEKGRKVEVPGARLYGTVDFNPDPAFGFPEGCRPSAGLRNAHDKSFALSVLSGAHVMICDNGMLSGEHQINRKHTSRIDLFNAVDRALNAFVQATAGFSVIYNRLKQHALTDSEAHSLIVECAKAGAISSAHILPAVEAWENPPHREFTGRNAFSLYNSINETMKRQSPARQVEGFVALNKVLLPQAA